MRLSEAQFPDQPPVDGYGPGFFRVAGVRIDGGLLAMPDAVGAWAGFDALSEIVERAGDIDVILVGTGAEMTALPTAFRRALEAAGIGVEPMASPAACRTYNVLLAEGRRVGLAALAVPGSPGADADPGAGA